MGLAKELLENRPSKDLFVDVKFGFTGIHVWPRPPEPGMFALAPAIVIYPTENRVDFYHPRWEVDALTLAGVLESGTGKEFTVKMCYTEDER